MAEFDPYKPMALDDPNRPIKIVSTVEAVVPEESRKYLVHEVDSVVSQDGREGFYHRLTLPEGVMVNHVGAKQRLTLVKQYRHTIGRWSVEAPSGGAEPRETAALLRASEEEKEDIFKIVGARETEEEIAHHLDPEDLHRMYAGPFQGSVGFAYQTYHLYHAEGGTPSVQKLDETEAGLTIEHPRIDEAVEMLGHEIVELASSFSVASLALMYDVRSDNFRAHARRESRFGSLLKSLTKFR